MGHVVYNVLGTLYRLMAPGSTNRDIGNSFDLSSRHCSSQLDRMSTLQGGRRSLLLTVLLTCLLGGKVPAQQCSGHAGERQPGQIPGRSLPTSCSQARLILLLAPYRETHPVPENSSSLPRQGMAAQCLVNQGQSLFSGPQSTHR